MHTCVYIFFLSISTVDRQSDDFSGLVALGGVTRKIFIRALCRALLSIRRAPPEIPHLGDSLHSVGMENERTCAETHTPSVTAASLPDSKSSDHQIRINYFRVGIPALLYTHERGPVIKYRVCVVLIQNEIQSDCRTPCTTERTRLQLDRFFCFARHRSGPSARVCPGEFSVSHIFPATAVS